MSEPSGVNVPLLRKAVEWAESEAMKPPGEFCAWRQGEWRTVSDCGTAFCVAGYVAQMQDERYADTEKVNGVHTAVAAAEALGIPTPKPCDVDGCACHATSLPLFSSGNSIADIRRIAEELAGERL